VAYEESVAHARPAAPSFFRVVPARFGAFRRSGGNLTREQRDEMIEGSFVQFACGVTAVIRLSGGHW
jgi:hypothetical protein